MPRKLPAVLVAVLSLTITTDAAGAGYATRTLQVGSHGSDVRALQRYLDEAGYNTIADGTFGPATRRSVMAFERREQRRVNGRASRTEQRMVRGGERQRRSARALARREGLRQPRWARGRARVGARRGEGDRRGGQRDRHEAVQVRRRPHPLERHGLRLLWLRELRPTRRRTSEPGARLDRI